MGFFGQAIKLLRRPSFRDFAWAFYGSLGLRVQADLVDTFTLLLMPYSPAHVLLRLRRLELGPLPVARESGGDASRMAPSAWFAARPNAILLALPESRVIRQPVAATASDTAHHCSSAMLSPAILGW